MDLIIILQAGVATGTVLLFATIGEIFSERAAPAVCPAGRRAAAVRSSPRSPDV